MAGRLGSRLYSGKIWFKWRKSSGVWGRSGKILFREKELRVLAGVQDGARG